MEPKPSPSGHYNLRKKNNPSDVEEDSSAPSSCTSDTQGKTFSTNRTIY